MKLISTRGPLSSPSLLQGAVLKYMMTGPENGTQRQALLRVIAAILHFSPPETQQVERSITDEATAIEDPVGTAMASTFSAWDALTGSAISAGSSSGGGGGGGAGSGSNGSGDSGSGAAGGSNAAEGTTTLSTASSLLAASPLRGLGSSWGGWPGTS
jgi:hypothetical protein